MKFKEPAGGWPLRLAVTELVREPFLQLAYAVTRLEGLAAARGKPDAQEADKRTLWYDVQEQLRLGELVAHGRRPGMPTGERIPPEFFDSAQPDYKADMMVAPDLTYYGVRITKAQPFHASGYQQPSTIPEKGKGGAPAKPGWPQFIAEVVRRADQDGLTTIRALKRDMLDWCVSNWNGHPDESTIRKKLLVLCPYLPRD